MKTLMFFTLGFLALFFASNSKASDYVDFGSCDPTGSFYATITDTTVEQCSSYIMSNLGSADQYSGNSPTFTDHVTFQYINLYSNVFNKSSKLATWTVTSSGVTICPDTYYLNKDGSGGNESECSRPTPKSKAEIVICLNGATSAPDWPDCAEGLDEVFVRGVDDDVQAAKDALAEIIKNLTYAEKEVILNDIKNNDISLQQAVKNLNDTKINLISHKAPPVLKASSA